MEQDIAELTRKIDQLAFQMQYLTEQAQRAERAGDERAELLRDLSPIANQAFRMTAEQLEEVQEYVDLGDLLRLLKRLLRNGPRIEQMLDQLESASDLLGVALPLTDEAMGKAVLVLEAADQKGYFGFAREATKIADNVVTSFSEEDVRLLGENVVLILQTVKSLTQPELMKLMQSAIKVVEPVRLADLDTSFLALAKQMRDPEVRRGLAIALRFLHGLGSAVPSS